MPEADRPASDVENLKLIQGVVDRLASNSFALKGWTVVILSAIFALGAANSETGFIPIALVPTVAFWVLDAYYLQQERVYRAMYNDAVERDLEYNLDPTYFRSKVASIPSIMFSVTLAWFYVASLVTVGVAIALVEF